LARFVGVASSISTERATVIGMILGVDAASVAGNKNINWTAAKAAGLSFAILRSNYGDQQDTMFAREWDRIREAGLVRGAYLSCATREAARRRRCPRRRRGQ
jgi:GH25 family lysozyme M1 (1,4-beta-N-acetylmuramidase)